MHTIPHIVFTGPAGSGKTTGITRTVEKLTELDWSPIVVPEAATALHEETGLFDLGLAPLELQRRILHYSIQAEKTARDLAQTLQKPVLILDRGIADQRAYIDDAQLNALLAEVGMPDGLVDIFNRYDLVIHMDAAPQAFYTTKNNPARRESREDAVIQGKRTEDARLGTAHRKKITNDYPSFDGKVDAAVQQILHFLGNPETRRVDKKYAVAPVDLTIFDRLGIAVHASTIVQDYLQTYIPGKIRRVRQRSFSPKGSLWTYTEKERSTHTFFDHSIDEKTYQQLLEQKDDAYVSLHKVRYHFVWQGQQYALDHYSTGNMPNLWLLEMTKAHPESTPLVPDFLTLCGDMPCNNEDLARKNK